MIAWYVVLNTLIFGALYWGRKDVVRFLQFRERINDTSDLDTFKAMVRRQMIAVVFLLPLGLGSILWAIQITRTEGLLGLLVVLAVSIPTFLFSQRAKAFEVQARSLVCSEPLAAEYASVSEAWVKRLLPNF